MRRVRILLVEDDPGHQALLALTIRQGRPHVRVTSVRDRDEFLQALQNDLIDCVVMDFHLSDCQADELLTLLHETRPRCPAIVVSGSSRQEVVVKSLRGGCMDFIHKDEAVTDDGLWGRIQTALRDHRRQENERRRLERRIHDLIELAEKDPLTGLANRRAIDHLLNNERRRTFDRRGQTVVVMIDIDHFKAINDNYGHEWGDRILQIVSGALRDDSAPTDIAARWGGEEFLILKPQADLIQTFHWADRLRARIASFKVTIDDRPVSVSASFGLTAVESEKVSLETIAEADEALYLAKRRGRNQVCTRRMVSFDALVRHVDGAHPEARLASFLERAHPLLGPTQREHLTAHSGAVGRLAWRLGKRLGMDDEALASLEFAGRCHDLGKCHMPDGTLAKPSPLSADERFFLTRQTPHGAQMARTLGADAEAAGYIAFHHERYDARPNERELPLGARILSVADAVVSMATRRPYRPAKSLEMIQQELAHEKGRQFDPHVVEAALSETRTCDSSHDLMATLR